MKRRFANGTVIASAMGLFCACTVVIGDLPEGGPSSSESGGSGGVAGSAGAAGVASGGVAGLAGTGNTGGSGGIAGAGGSAGATGGVGGVGGVSGAGGGTCKNPPCDCDGDTFAAKGVTCNGNDCDDLDDRAHPGQAEYFDTPSKGVGGYDFDCSGSPNPKFHVVNCGVGLLSCPIPPGDGYANPVPGCGVEAMYITCVMSGAVCVKQNTSPLKMPCK